MRSQKRNRENVLKDEDINKRAIEAVDALGVPIPMRQAAVELIDSHDYEKAAKRAGGRRRINAERKARAWKRREEIKELLGGHYILLGASRARGMKTTLAENSASIAQRSVMTKKRCLPNGAKITSARDVARRTTSL